MKLGKHFASATLQLTLSSAAVRLLSLVTMPLLTRLLPPEAYGASAMIGTIVSLLSVIALSGMDMSYIRSYHAKEPPSGIAVELFAWRYAIGLGLVAAFFSAIGWWFVVADNFKLPKYLAYLLGIGILLSIANTMAHTRARLNDCYRSMSISNVASAVGAALVSIGVALWWRQDEFPLIISMVVGYFIPVLILGMPAYRGLFYASGLTLGERSSVIKIGLAGIVTAPMYWVISSLDRWFLGYFEDSASVGIYSIGYSVAIMGMMFNNALTSVWLPEAARVYEHNPLEAQTELGKLAGRFIAVLAVIWLAVTAAGGDIIRLLSSSRFHTAVDVVPFIAGAVFFHGILHLATAGILLKKKLHYTMWWWFGGAILCIVMNLVLVPLFGGLGASMTQTSTFGFVAFGVVCNAQKLFPLRLSKSKLLLIIFTILLLGIVMHPAWSRTPLKSLMIKLPLGISAALLVFKYIAPENLNSLLDRFSRSMKNLG